MLLEKQSLTKLLPFKQKDNGATSRNDSFLQLQSSLRSRKFKKSIDFQLEQVEIVTERIQINFFHYSSFAHYCFFKYVSAAFLLRFFTHTMRISNFQYPSNDYSLPYTTYNYYRSYSVLHTISKTVTYSMLFSFP